MTALETFHGAETFAAAPEPLFAALTNPDALAQAIPGRVSHTRADDRTLRCIVRPGFSFIRANLSLTLTIARAVPHSEVALDVASQGIGASMQVECEMHITPENGGSRVTWTARVVKLGGLIAAVSPALIRGAADKVIRDGWALLRAQVESPA